MTYRLIRLKFGWLAMFGFLPIPVFTSRQTAPAGLLYNQRVLSFGGGKGVVEIAT
jgi:hypothetical protein